MDVEDTVNWFSQKTGGSVWYFGEISQNFENDLLDNIDGSWRSGKDGAKPGIVMLASPSANHSYRQEWHLNGSEDVATVISFGNTITVPAGQFTNCVEIEESTPLEPEEKERKFYAPGIGLVREVDLTTGEVLDLIQIIN